MVQVEIRASDDHELFMNLLCIDASFTMMPHATPKSILIKLHPRFWGPNPKPSTSGFEAWTTKPSWRSVFAMPSPLSRHVSSSVLDRPITKSSCASAWLGQPFSWLGQQDTLLHMYTCLLMSPSVNHPWSVFWPPWSLCLSFMSVLHHFWSIGMTCLYLSFSIAVGRLCAPHLCTTSQEACCTNNTLNAMVSLQTQPKLDHLLTIIHHQLDKHGVGVL